MLYHTLSPNLPPSSILGFGCASLMNRVGKKQSLDAIARALDAGITHFDVARAYGLGEAEVLLGEAIAGCREKVVVVTKFGLSPPRAARYLRWVRPIARKAVSFAPHLRRVSRAVVGSNVPVADRFSPAAANGSLESSLKALRTDYIDVFMLHDCVAADLSDSLLDFLMREIEKGKIRAIGLATSVDQIRHIASNRGLMPICQIANSVMHRNIEKFGHGPRILTHSTFEGADRLATCLESRKADAPKTVSPLGLTDIQRLMLSYALAANPRGSVIVSMVRPEHLRTNVAVAERPPFSPDEIRAYIDFAARCC